MCLRCIYIACALGSILWLVLWLARLFEAEALASAALAASGEPVKRVARYLVRQAATNVLAAVNASQ